MDIIEACARGDIKEVKEFLSQGFDKDHAAGWPIQKAAEQGHKELVAYFMSIGADVRLHHDRLLRCAIQSRNVEIVDMVLDAGGDFNNMEKYWGKEFFARSEMAMYEYARSRSGKSLKPDPIRCPKCGGLSDFVALASKCRDCWHTW